jgi:peptidoglycan lytic transglycosylase
MTMSNKNLTLMTIIITTTFLLGACAKEQSYSTAKGKSHYRNKGEASWYGPGFAGRKTANGERFNPNKLTAAHRKLPFDTNVRVTHIENGKSVIVRINDRGPYAKGRLIDLSKAAAREIDMLGSGFARVEIVALAKNDEKKKADELMSDEEALRKGTPPPEDKSHKQIRRFNPQPEASTTEVDVYEEQKKAKGEAEVPGVMEEF